MPHFVKSGRLPTGPVLVLVLVISGLMIGGCHGKNSRDIFKKRIDKAMKK